MLRSFCVINIFKLWNWYEGSSCLFAVIRWVLRWFDVVFIFIATIALVVVGDVICVIWYHLKVCCKFAQSEKVNELNCVAIDVDGMCNHWQFNDILEKTAYHRFNIVIHVRWQKLPNRIRQKSNKNAYICFAVCLWITNSNKVCVFIRLV